MSECYCKLLHELSIINIIFLKILKIMTSENLGKISLVFKKCMGKRVNRHTFCTWVHFFRQLSVLYDSDKCYGHSFITYSRFEIKNYVCCFFSYKKHFIFIIFILFVVLFISLCFFLFPFSEWFWINLYWIAEQNDHACKKPKLNETA